MVNEKYACLLQMCSAGPNRNVSFQHGCLDTHGEICQADICTCQMLREVLSVCDTSIRMSTQMSRQLSTVCVCCRTTTLGKKSSSRWASHLRNGRTLLLKVHIKSRMQYGYNGISLQKTHSVHQSMISLYCTLYAQHHCTLLTRVWWH